VPPPAFPILVRPWAPDRPKHVSAENPGAKVGKPELGHFVIDTCVTIRLSMHATPHTRSEEPLHQFSAIDTQGILKILVWTGAVPVNRYGEALDTKFRHNALSISRIRESPQSTYGCMIAAANLRFHHEWPSQRS